MRTSATDGRGGEGDSGAGEPRELDAAEAASAERLFCALLDLPPAARDAALSARGPAEARVVAEVRALLAFADEGSSGPLDQADGGGLIGAAAESLARALEERTEGGSPCGSAASGPALRPNAVVGRYRIVRALGAGAMGVVYLAEQEKPRRTVALKVVRPGLAMGRGTGPILRRFEHEAELLGRLQHPGIAQIIEAGAVDSGAGAQPYFAMEYVDGRSLRAHADAERLPTRARIELVLGICDAIEHAHQRGVIHRDLKPDNILVDATGQPKILDFGIARATRAAGAGGADATQLTHAQQLLGTLAYMSPEQAGGDPDAVDTRSDVYALGAILFELLAGGLPHDLAGATIVDAIRIIREREPRRLADLRPELRGDLDVICAKALAGERDQRYQSAAELATDLRRFLRHEPIAARPPSTLYQLVKFARRRRALVAGIGVAVLALVVGFAVSVAAWRKARTEAQRQAAVATFFREMLEGVAPTAALGADTTLLRQVLDQTARRIASELDTAPEVKAELLEMVGTVYLDLSDFQGAESALRSALEIEAGRGLADSPRAASVLGALGRVRRELGQYAEAGGLAERAAALRLTLFGEESLEYAASREELAKLHAVARRFDDAEGLMRRALATRERLLGSGSDEVATTLHALGTILSLANRDAEAVRCSERALAIVEGLHSGDHPAVATALTVLGEHVAGLHDIARSEELLVRALEMNRRMLGVGHAQTIGSMVSVATILMMRGQHEAADALIGETLEAIRRRFGPDSVRLALALGVLAEMKGSPAETLVAYEEALAVMRRATSDRPESTMDLKTNVELAAGLDPERESSLLRAIEIGREIEQDLTTLGERANQDRILLHLVTYGTSLAERAWARMECDPDESAALVAEAESILARATEELTAGSPGWRRPLHGARAAATIARVAMAARRPEGPGESTPALRRRLDEASGQLSRARENDLGTSPRNGVLFFGPRAAARWRERLEHARGLIEAGAPAG